MGFHAIGRITTAIGAIISVVGPMSAESRLERRPHGRNPRLVRSAAASLGTIEGFVGAFDEPDPYFAEVSGERRTMRVGKGEIVRDERALADAAANGDGLAVRA